jgi:hypothetical protein
MKTADDGCREMVTFKAAWHSTEIQELWGKTKAEGFSQGTDTWKIDYRTAIKNLKQKEEGLLSAEKQSTTVEEEPKDVVDKCRTKYPALKLELSDEVTIWPLTLTVAGMAFEIDKQGADDAKIYQIGAKPGKRISNIQQDILKMVQERKPRDSLAYLLVRRCSK